MVPGPSVHNWELAFDASISGRERIEEWHAQDSWNRWPPYRQSLWRPLPTTGAIAEIDSKNGLRALAGKTRLNAVRRVLFEQSGNYTVKCLRYLGINTSS
jgi:hypothetical protein